MRHGLIGGNLNIKAHAIMNITLDDPAGGDDHRGNGQTSASLSVTSASAMQWLGRWVSQQVRGGDVILLSGPLGAGKTTFAQGFAAGLRITQPVVSPTFTIARELDGRFADGSAAHLIHVDAYRLGGVAYAPGQNSVSRLLDELESLGLDEELEDPGEHSVVLMEWGEQMAAALAAERLQIRIDRPSEPLDQLAGAELTSEGTRMVSITGIGARWRGFTVPADLRFGND